MDRKTMNAAHVVEQYELDEKGRRRKAVRPQGLATREQLERIDAEGRVSRYDHDGEPYCFGDVTDIRSCACGYAVCSNIGPCAPARPPEPIKEPRKAQPFALGDVVQDQGFGDTGRVTGTDHDRDTDEWCFRVQWECGFEFWYFAAALRPAPRSPETDAEPFLIAEEHHGEPWSPPTFDDEGES